MAGKEIELNPVDFITIGTIGPRGQRIFHLQSGQGKQLVSLIIEKEQARALSEAIREMLDDLGKRNPNVVGSIAVNLSGVDMDLREPIEPVFRVAQMGLGYDEDHDLVVLVAQELVASTDLEELSEHELIRIRARYARLAAAARERLRRGETDIDSPELDAD